MKAVVMNGTGGPEVLSLGTAADPEIGPDDLLVRVRACALNRADLLQRRGLYPPPPDASPILGLEMAGEVAAVGERAAADFQIGDRVCALLPGGGYAEYAAVPAALAMRLPERMSFSAAAAVPEAFLTAYMNLRWLGRLQPSETVLVHAAASGVGTAALQLIRELGATALATAGSDEKLQRCRQLGAADGWNYRRGTFADWAIQQTDGRGVDIVLDFVGASYFADNLRCLARGGRLVVIGTLDGGRTEGLDLLQLLTRSLTITGTTLRSQPLEEKIRLTHEFVEYALPRFADGRLEAVIDREFSWRDAADAHAYMEENRNIGKIVLTID